MQPYVIDLIALAIIILGIVMGAARGLLLTVYSMVKIILMIVLVVVLYPVMKTIVPEHISWVAGLAVLVAMIVAAVALGMVAKVLHLVDKVPVIRGINRLAGAILGGVLGLIVVLAALLVISLSQSAEWCREIYPCVQQSSLLRPLFALLHDLPIPLIHH